MVSAGIKDQPAKPLPPGMKAPKVDFRDLGSEAGLDAIVISGEEMQKYVIENTGTGVALFDYDNDGLLDIFLVNGDRFEPTHPPLTSHLYHNLGGLRFENVTKKAGIIHMGWGQGVCAGDIDNDGFVDLFVGHWRRNVLWHNQGDGTFQNEAGPRGLLRPEERWSTGCAFLDYDRDDDLDLVVSNYIEFEPETIPLPGEPDGCKWKGYPVPCGPMGLPGESMSLFRNDGAGIFTDVSAESGVEGPKSYYAFTVLTADFDNDGWTDFYITSDSTPSLMYHNNGDGTFEEIGVYSGAAYNEDGKEQAGMGATAADYNGDGFIDILKTNFSNDIPTLYRNNGDGTFLDVTITSGLAVHTQYVKWGVAFLDFDQDGWEDVLIADGHVYPFVDKLPLGETFHQPRQLFWNRRDGEFFDMSNDGGPGVSAAHSSRGVALGDLDNDGSQEAVIVNLFEPPSLLKNFGERGNSILLQLLTASGRAAIGARVKLTANNHVQIDEVRSGGNHISQSDYRLNFGLGRATSASIEVRWPDGKPEIFDAIPANRWTVIRQGKGIVETKQFTKPPE